MILDLSSKINSMAINSDLYLTLITLDDNINDNLMAMRTPPPFLVNYLGSSGSTGCEVVDLSQRNILYKLLGMISLSFIVDFNQVSFSIIISGSCS